MRRIMPSAANLIAGAGFALLGLIVSMMIPSLLPDNTDVGYLYHVNVLLGFCVGWSVVGRRMGRGWTPAINAGLTGAVVLVFWGIFVQAINEMTLLAMRNRYDNAFDALVAVVEIGTEWAILIATVPILSVLVVGGACAGLIAEVADRHWR